MNQDRPIKPKALGRPTSNAGQAPHPSEQPPTGRLRQKLYRIIFESDTPAGKGFDILLLIAILLSVVAVMLESVAPIREQYGQVLYAFEWLFTLLFTLEYIVRLFSVRSPLRYAKSFFGVVDLLATLPTYISLFVPGAQSLLIIRSFRLLRIFRIFKLTRYLREGRTLLVALAASRQKITVFVGVVLSLVMIIGSLMYLIEGPEHGFTSIPRSMYWAIVTMTTVGYGDIAPQTTLGQMFASLVMVLGYGIIAVPTGIVTVEIATASSLNLNERACPVCDTARHLSDAVFCRVCGSPLPETEKPSGNNRPAT